MENLGQNKYQIKYGNNEKNGYPDIIIVKCTVKLGKNTLERRISDPSLLLQYSKMVLTCILYDEVHLYDGITRSRDCINKCKITKFTSRKI